MVFFSLSLDKKVSLLLRTINTKSFIDGKPMCALLCLPDDSNAQYLCE